MAWPTLSSRILAMVGLSTLLIAGCQGYNWKHSLVEFEQAQQQAQAQNKYIFVFYKYWLDDDSNRMLDREVLSDPQVEALFRNTINFLFERSYGPDYQKFVAQYGVTEPPACIIVAPDGRSFVLQGYANKQELIDFVKNSMTPPADTKSP